MGIELSPRSADVFNRQHFENSRIDGFAVLEIVGGSPEERGQPRRFVPLKRTELKGEIVGPLASLRQTQIYGYTAEQCDKTIEALYRFPLPGDAAVSSVRVRFGNVEIRTELKPRGEAESEYQKALQEARQAVLATRESPDVFTLRVGGIQPGEDVEIETSYVQLARSEGAGWSLRIPLTTAPRYTREDEAGSRHAHGQPLAAVRDPGHRFSMDVFVQESALVESRTHALGLTQSSQGCRVRLKEGDVLPDRDCVLAWRPKQEQDRSGLAVVVENDPDSEFAYFLALVAPPATFDRGSGLPREVIVLVDRSGSMGGAKWQASEWAVERFLGELSARDAFGLGVFHSQTFWFDKQQRPAGEEDVSQAVAYLKGYRESGGTELGVALEQALHRDRTEGNLARHVLVITDAQVTDDGRILSLADAESKKPERRRISVLCIDAAPNSLLAETLAERGGGVHRSLTSDPQQDDITTALDEVLADWSEPVLAGLRLEVNRAPVEAVGRTVGPARETGWNAVDLGDLPAGRPLWCVGRVPRTEMGNLAFRLVAGKGHEIASCRPSPRSADARPAIKPLFGARRILALEELVHYSPRQDDLEDRLLLLGYDPAALLGKRSEKKVYAENTRQDLKAVLDEILVAESLNFGLASAETAFIATRSEPGKPVESFAIVANALPAGWDDSMLMRSKRLAGSVGGSLEMLCCVMMQDDRRAGGAGAGIVAGDSFSGDTVSAETVTSYLQSFDAVASTAAPRISRPQTFVLFSGEPALTAETTILFDSKDATPLGPAGEQGVFNFLEVVVPADRANARHLDPGLCLLLYVDDLSAPRARVKLADIIRQGGRRPLNIDWRAEQRVQLALADPARAWRKDPPHLQINLGVRPAG
jgi:Ca-activated chloride channel homolog